MYWVMFSEAGVGGNKEVMVFKEDLWCGYCGEKDFNEIPDVEHPNDSRYSEWECTNCHAVFEDNPGYGYFTTYWGNNSPDDSEKYSLNTGELLDDSKRPRTPEGIVRHCGSQEELVGYLRATQIK